MLYRALADLTVLIHAGFVVFAVLGGLLSLRWPKAAWIHLPTATWAALIEFAGWICPLTPLEVHLRRLGGEAGYGGGFVEHYLLPVLYPGNLTRNVQIALGAIVVVLNIAVYSIALRRALRRLRQLGSGE